MTIRFDQPVPAGGYAWWYIDAISDDGNHGLTLIAFVGSVFSPYYAWARRRAGPAGADPLNHCAVNVALYGRSGSRWATYPRARLSRRRAHQTPLEAETNTIAPTMVKRPIRTERSARARHCAASSATSVSWQLKSVGYR